MVDIEWGGTLGGGITAVIYQRAGSRYVSQPIAVRGALFDQKACMVELYRVANLGELHAKGAKRALGYGFNPPSSASLPVMARQPQACV